MAQSTVNPMTSLYARLGSIGLPRAYVRSTLLPSWWNDDAAVSPAGYAEAVMLVARHVGFDIRTLRGEDQEPKLAETGTYKFKHAKSSVPEDLTLARHLATQVARFAASAAPVAYKPLGSAAEIRRAMLDRGDAWIALENLLDFCWSSGVPVLHVSNFPRNARKMDGLSAMVDGRPVIVISKEHKHPAWLLFILAHEMGHVARGHVGDNEVLVDEKIDRSGPDAEEREADAFALELLCGNAGVKFYAAGRWPNAEGLARQAVQIGERQHIDPGHIVLNYANTMGPKFWPVANAALQSITPAADAVAIVRAKLAANLDWSNLTEDASEFVTNMTGASTTQS